MLCFFFSAPRACGCLHAGCCSPPVFLNCYGGSRDFTFSLRAFNFPVTRCGVPCIFFTVQTQILVRAACPSTWLRTGLSARRASLRTGLQEGGRVSRRASGRAGECPDGTPGRAGGRRGQGGRAFGRACPEKPYNPPGVILPNAGCAINDTAPLEAGENRFGGVWPGGAALYCLN